MFPEVDEDFTVGTTIDDQIVRTSGKFELLDRILPKLFATGHKVSLLEKSSVQLMLPHYSSGRS